jgi:hypothetical protein
MQVRNFVTVTDNPALERLEGLDQLERAGDSVLVSTNPELVSAELPGDLRLATSRAGARIIDTGNLVFARLATRSFAQAGRAPRLSWGILSPGLAYDALEPSHVDHP